ncbi:M20/M25/M40 family metallo-hydrolase [Halosimplex aquaticum]|uniref:M20/M25/M40 family metallo-hydrolase n=1 Tax=Halosimplex aquaticum TaxID=3026162 RepID=A0ABD5Y2W1_9EURY|nr:M20/M25/M40 family metallo-hydrolase [Halosimplex aquaticum]
MEDFAAAYGDRARAFTERLVRFETTAGDEAPAQEWVRDRLADLGFETYTWTADADTLADHPSFAPADDLVSGGRPSVAGVLELGDPDAGRTLVLNGHVDVVPAGESGWTVDPFEPRWDGARLVGRGAVDMKSQLATCVFAARHLADRVEAGEFDLDGRVVVESVAGEEDGGIGAATAALSNPYPFERDAAIVAEPTDMRVVTATEGCLMGRIRIEGTPAHAARRWEGESVLPAFESVRQAFADLEAERAETVTHPLYDRFETPWPIVIGRVEAGTWASNVPGTLTAELRVGVAPGESLDRVEAACRKTLDEAATEESWSVDPPTFERFGVQFASAEIGADEPVVTALQGAMAATGLSATDPTGETYGSDARHYVEAGIPAVVFGPGRIEEAHFPDESIRWPDVLTAGEALVGTARRYLADERR